MLDSIIQKYLNRTTKPESSKSVLLFLPRYPPYRGGPGIYFTNILDKIPREYRFSILTAYHPDKQLIEEDDEATIYRVIPREEMLPRPLRFILEFISAFVATIYIVIRENIDIAHIHSTSYSSPAVAVAIYLFSMPILYDCRDVGFPKFLVTFGQTTFWFSSAPNVDDRLIESGVPKPKIIRTPIINPPYTKDYKNSQENEEDSFVVIFVGTLRKQKGAHLLLDAFEKVNESYEFVTLKIVGDGPQREVLEQKVKSDSLESSVEFVGEVDHKTVLQRISEADVLVHPSAQESGPRSVTEAIEIGTPVIATNVGIVSDLISHNKSGLIINRTAEDIQSAIIELLQNPKLRREYAEKARQNRNNTSWEAVASLVSKAYEES